MVYVLPTPKVVQRPSRGQYSDLLRNPTDMKSSTTDFTRPWLRAQIYSGVDSGFRNPDRDSGNYPTEGRQKAHSSGRKYDVNSSLTISVKGPGEILSVTLTPVTQSDVSWHPVRGKTQRSTCLDEIQMFVLPDPDSRSRKLLDDTLFNGSEGVLESVRIEFHPKKDPFGWESSVNFLPILTRRPNKVLKDTLVLTVRLGYSDHPFWGSYRDTPVLTRVWR